MSQAQPEALAITPEQLKQYSEAFNADRANLVAANASVSNGILEAATAYRGVRALPRTFSVELKQGSITNQRHSGRCWMFASLNTLRYELMHKWNLEDFEFSETYLFFYDKIEKANHYLENILKTLDEPTDSRLFQEVNGYPVGDGGWWQMFVNLVKKYGLVPKDAYPESANSKDSGAFEQYLTTKVREFAAELRDAHKAGKSEDELRAMKTEMMGTVYRICAIALGEPPAAFDVLLRVKDGDDDKKDTDAAKDSDKKDAAHSGIDARRQIVEHGITPQEFYAKYVGQDLDDFVSLTNAPLANRPYYRRYALKWEGNVAEAGSMEFVNVPLDVFRKAAVDQLSAGHPIWFACDCMQFSLRKAGIFDKATVRVDELFGTEFTFDKAQGLEYQDSPSNHAMTLTGVNLDGAGEPDRWKVENSWGKENGVDGYYVASGEWFDRFVQEIIIRKEYLDADTLKALETEPVELEPWEPISRICR
ncbi:aminopeptidase C [Bifidobacterium avesanii]|uniref:Aminopeptidase n=1 Tax=Bifidobacterium avesanii TaxID=1798157 RepID=A0A7K3TJR3_9BIFI|nr:C1 family peptidase [Bifidobacterium avesanii]KAB8289899.1 aminopeptidase C [Bifidobacterium avesanii]NEG78860.1 aminopeptidase [Bifidobacterium avesanii]